MNVVQFARPGSASQLRYRDSVRALRDRVSPVKLRSYLAILVLVGVVPLSILTILVGVSLVRQQRAAVDRGMSDTVTALAALIQNELETSIRSLETLATSQRLDTDDLSAFYEQARRVREHHRWSTIGLIDNDGNHRLNLARPLGESLPDLRDREYFKQVVATGQPYVSDLLRGRATGTTDIGVAVPVSRGGRLKYVLFAGVDPARFSQMFQEQALPTGAIATIVGRDGIVVTRIPDHGGKVGRTLPGEYTARIGEKSEGQAQRISFEGVKLQTAYRRMSLTGWLVDLGMPEDVLNAPVRRIAWLAAILGGILVFAAFGLAVIFARRMASDIDALTSLASRIGHGSEPLQRSGLHVAEFHDMHRSMVKADETLTTLLASEHSARAEAEALNRAKDHFLAMLSHELRNPLGAIVSATSLLKRGDADAPMIERARAIVERQAQHLSRLVDDLLDVSRMTSGKVMLTHEPLDFADLTNSVSALWRSAGRLEHHTVTVDMSPVWVEGDRTRLEQVVGNILTNALKYTPPGGAVTLALGQEGTEAVLRVRDTGMGIAPDMLPRIFDLFVQSDMGLARADGGLGVGLTLVRRLVELHGGRVTADSEGEGRGSTFTVRLPAIAVPVVVAAEPAVQEPPAAVRLRVLVVEDNDDAREMLRVGLVLAGHEVVEAADGPSGVELAEQTRPDVAFIDVGLPGLDGYEVARRLRARGMKNSRLIALTGYGRPEDRARALEAGFDGYIVKPVDPETLTAALRSREAPRPQSVEATKAEAARHDMPDRWRADKTLDKMRRGGLPAPTEHTRKIAVGDGRSCHGCTEPIEPTEALHDIHARGILDLRFHETCYVAWVTFER
jgi:signal transduction histidine kinase/AmiR/NasT family two-component response regulator